MIFQHTWELVLAGQKTQTRRLVMSGDEYRGDYVYHIDDGWCGHEGPYPAYPGRVKWAVGKDYAVQPGRGKKAVGRIRLTGIRQEHVQDITEADAIAEGMIKGVSLYPYRCPHCHGYGTMPSSGCEVCHAAGGFYTAVEAYRELWKLIHTKPGARWTYSPLVWVLEFELVKEA